MAWIESHQSLSRHRKTLRAAALLKVDRHKLIGHLHELWWWGLDNVPANGSLAGLSDDEIGESAGWPKGRREFVMALIEAGFIDQRGEERLLHDWYDYAGKLAEQRAAERERSRRRRTPSIDMPPDRPPSDQRLTDGQPADDRQTTAGTVPNRTGPNPTGPNHVNNVDLQTRSLALKGERVAAATSPEHQGNGRKSEHAKSRSLGPLAEAFTAAGLPFPDVIGSEISAAQTLMSHYQAAEIAECWRDVQQSDRYDQFDRTKLSFGYLSRDNRLGNWQQWRDAGKPLEVHPHAAPTNHARPAGEPVSGLAKWSQ
jgi:hypothetical protein